MAKADTSAYTSFGQISGRLDQIIAAVRDKDTSLERSLDLFDEAIALGSKAVDMVDTTDFTEEERLRLQRDAQESAQAQEPSADASAAGGETDATQDAPAQADPSQGDQKAAPQGA